MTQRVTKEEIGRYVPPTEDTPADMDRPRRPARTQAAGASTPISSDLRRTLSSRRTLRQAILLNEILGPPKALQESTDPSSFNR